MYAMVPTFMIRNYLEYTYSREQLVSHLAEVFNVPEVFMDARLELLEQRMRTLAAEAQLAEAIRESSASYDYTFRHPLNHRIEYLVRDGQVIGRRRRAEIQEDS
jgi:Zn-dependent peptidase ImmA (M78 family)